MEGMSEWDNYVQTGMEIREVESRIKRTQQSGILTDPKSRYVGTSGDGK